MIEVDNTTINKKKNKKRPITTYDETESDSDGYEQDVDESATEVSDLENEEESLDDEVWSNIKKDVTQIVKGDFVAVKTSSDTEDFWIGKVVDSKKTPRRGYNFTVHWYHLLHLLLHLHLHHHHYHNLPLLLLLLLLLHQRQQQHQHTFHGQTN